MEKGALNMCSFSLPIKGRLSHDARRMEIKKRMIATLMGGDWRIGGIVLFHLQDP